MRWLSEGFCKANVTEWLFLWEWPLLVVELRVEMFKVESRFTLITESLSLSKPIGEHGWKAVAILPGMLGRIKGGTGYTALHGDPLDCGERVAGD